MRWNRLVLGRHGCRFNIVLGGAMADHAGFATLEIYLPGTAAGVCIVFAAAIGANALLASSKPSFVAARGAFGGGCTLCLLLCMLLLCS